MHQIPGLIHKNNAPKGSAKNGLKYIRRALPINKPILFAERVGNGGMQVGCFGGRKYGRWREIGLFGEARSGSVEFAEGKMDGKCDNFILL